MSEWIEWSGGEQPMADDLLVECRFADGSQGENASELWVWDSKHAPIIAYRIVSDKGEAA